MGRRLVVGAALAACVAVFASWLLQAHLPPRTDDFISYWAAARALAAGQNPYDQLTLDGIQRSAGWRQAVPLPAWYGPWILVTAIPLTMFPYWPSRVLWLVAQIGCLFAAGSWPGVFKAARVPAGSRCC